MIAGGLGCRRGCAADEIVRAIELALNRAGMSLDEVHALYAPAFKLDESGLACAAAQLGKQLVLLPLEQLQLQAHAALSDSPQVAERFGLPSIAETAALAGALTFAQAQQAARLLAPRSVVGGATCALAERTIEESNS